MYGISEKVYIKLIDYFKRNDNIKKAILFGSRAKGNFKLNSDIDLCIDCSENYKGTIKEDIEDIIGVYSCDLVFMDSLNEEIEKQVNRYGICIYNE
ncbi:nucleotidyltransferase domain-containing protein [Clostridium oceanicum]|uniref:Nucleotidyltransferase domain-containing protein n=1 Tax=Clostridium oceanicum TaxID=1543 RepID=A0ABN1JUB0_9CLOT